MPRNGLMTAELANKFVEAVARGPLLQTALNSNWKGNSVSAQQWVSNLLTISTTSRDVIGDYTPMHHHSFNTTVYYFFNKLS